MHENKEAGYFQHYMYQQYVQLENSVVRPDEDISVNILAGQPITSTVCAMIFVGLPCPLPLWSVFFNVLCHVLRCHRIEVGSGVLPSSASMYIGLLV